MYEHNISHYYHVTLCPVTLLYVTYKHNISHYYHVTLCHVTLRHVQTQQLHTVITSLELFWPHEHLFFLCFFYFIHVTLYILGSKYNFSERAVQSKHGAARAQSGAQ